MALVVKDRVQEITTTTGTGTLTLGGAVLGFQTFAVIGNANQTYYAIADPTTGDYEVGIGTYTASGTTLSRTTVLESSNSNSLVNFAAGSKNVFCTYPAERAVYLDTAGSAVTLLDIGTLGVGTANITTANITSGTISTAPTSNTDIVNKQYADAIASGIHFHEAVNLATTTALPANTYNNGTSGVGATLTANANGALSVDSTLTITSERILVKNEAAGANNGVYTVTQVGSAGTPYILTRATDFDTVGTGVDQIDEGDFFLVTSGTANVNTAWVQQTAPPITIGTTALVFQQFSAPITYTAGTGLSESPSYTFNIANIGTAGTYGGAASVPVFTTNAQGQVTSVTPTGIAIAAAAVSGLAASATTDTTNASNISSGTLGTSRLSGSYTGITGAGTLTAGTWNASAIAAIYGGTGQTSYAVGDLVYADTTTTLAKLPDVAVGNALISGGVSAAPSYGKIGLATHVSGTLPTANGGTNLTGFTANGVVYASSTSALTTGTDLTFDGTALNLGGTGKRITGDFSNATVANRVIFQTSTANSATRIDAIPSGTGTVGEFGLFNNSDTTNAGYAAIRMRSGDMQITSEINGTGTYLPMTFYTGGSERARIDTSGNVGIGLTPTASVGALQVTGGIFATSTQYVGAAGSTAFSGGIQNLSNTSKSISIEADPTNAGANSLIIFNIDATERMRIDSSGNVGIGNTAPNTKLDVYGPASVTSFTGTTRLGVTVQGATSTNDYSGIDFTQSNNTPRARIASVFGGGGSSLSFGTSNNYGSGITNTAFTLDPSGNATAAGNVTAYSDERKKKNWRDLQPDFVEQLAIVKHGIYDRIDEEITQVGVSAQALRPIMEHAVLEDENGNLSVAYGNAALVACVKLAQRVVDLEERLKALESK